MSGEINPINWSIQFMLEKRISAALRSQGDNGSGHYAISMRALFEMIAKFTSHIFPLNSWAAKP